MMATRNLARARPELTEQDPIYAAIDRVRAAYAELDAACSECEQLEKALPPTKRQSNNFNGELSIALDDDERWIAYSRRHRAASDGLDVQSIALLDVQPTTLAGLSALLRFAFEFEGERGIEWPDTVEGFVPNKPKDWSTTWSVALHKHAADTIDALTRN